MPCRALATESPVQFASLDEVPPFAPLSSGDPLKVTLTGSAHNEDGWLRKNDPRPYPDYPAREEQADDVCYDV